MESPEPPKLFARDIVAFSDAELDRYLEENDRSLTLCPITSIAAALLIQSL